MIWIRDITIQALSELIVWHSSSTLHIQMLRIWLIALVAVVCFSANNQSFDYDQMFKNRCILLKNESN